MLKIIYNFGTVASDGMTPEGPVMQGTHGKLYGTTNTGGSVGQGIVYQLSATGAYKIIHNFTGTPVGDRPPAGLVQGSDNFLYGVTTAGGAFGYGTFFKLNTTGTTYSVIHHFDGRTSGDSPLSTPTLHTNGIIYGWATVGPAEGRFYSMNVGLKPFASLVVLTPGKVGRR